MATKTTGKTVQAQRKTAAAMLRDRKIEAYWEKIQQQIWKVSIYQRTDQNRKGRYLSRKQINLHSGKQIILS